MFWKRVVTTLHSSKEAGRVISAANASHVQDIHDSSMDLGADCATPIWGSVYESARIWEAALPFNSSHGSLHHDIMPKALQTHLGVKDRWDERGPWVSAVFPNHVVYDHKGDTYKLGYSLTQGAAGTDPAVTFKGQPKKVHVAYVDTQDSATEAVKFLTDMPSDITLDKERFVSKAERSGMDAKDFAGKGQSFPINKAGDVDAALKSIGRAGADNYDAATLKANILKIAKRKGFAIPQSDQESVVTTLLGDEIVVSESAEFCMDAPQTIELLTSGAKEAASSGKATTVPIKIIGPGWGSMAHYSKEMIQSSGPKVFTRGTHMYWNHPTASQESERPEGDLNDLAAVLTKDATWQESGPKGPGLYSEAKVFSDYATQVAEKGAHIGISINTPIKFMEGDADGKHGRLAKEFVKTPLSSADFVTRAGAKGAPLVQAQEADRRESITIKENTMTPEEIKALQDRTAILEAENAKLKEAQNVTLATGAVQTVLKEAGVSIGDAIIRRLCVNPVMKDGKVDEAWVKALVTDLTAKEAGVVTGLGDQRSTVQATEALTDAEIKEMASTFADLGVPEKGLVSAVRGR